ncbi:MAG: helix-turn-helix transcriptional regulator [Gammaproteobacteria bacterium]|nr:helix-turn-helix transcriptional regulator [Gammaproteobacteria bacterium]
MSNFQSALIRASAFEQCDRLASVKAFCDSHLAEKITLKTVADIACLEYTYFSSYFHNTVGVRFGDWLRYQRVLRAQSVIRGSTMPLSKLAKQCGFNNLRTFQRAFRRVTGMTPRQFRREVRLGFAAYNAPLPGFSLPESPADSL